MKPNDLILRCFAERKGNLWQAFCIDLNLAAQGKTFPEVKNKLHSQIASYLHDALAGEDKVYADQLLHRKAPVEFRIRYHYYSLLCNFYSAKKNICKIFTEVMPLTLSQNHA